MSRTPKSQQLSVKRYIEDAERVVGSLSELSRQLDWPKGAIAACKNGTRPLPPYRAAQLAKIQNEREDPAIFLALAGQSKTAGEKDYWMTRWKDSFERSP